MSGTDASVKFICKSVLNFKCGVLLLSLTRQGYDPELFSKALPCLSAIGCALSPDYSLSNQDDGYYNRCVAEASWTYDPSPVDTSAYVSYYNYYKQRNSDIFVVQNYINYSYYFFV